MKLIILLGKIVLKITQDLAHNKLNYRFQPYLTMEKLIALNKDLLKNGAMCNSVPNGMPICCAGWV